MRYARQLSLIVFAVTVTMMFASNGAMASLNLDASTSGSITETKNGDTSKAESGKNKDGMGKGGKVSDDIWNPENPTVYSSFSQSSVMSVNFCKLVAD